MSSIGPIMIVVATVALTFILLMHRGAEKKEQLRDQFATAAMHGALVTVEFSEEEGQGSEELIARLAYQMADAMMKARDHDE